MSEIHNDNPEIKSSSPEVSHSEPPKPSEGDKEKLSPQETDAAKNNRESSEQNNPSESPEPPKLDPSNGEQRNTSAADTSISDNNESEHGKLRPEQPANSNPEQPKEQDPEQPKEQSPEQPKEQNPEQPKEQSPEQPKEQSPEQPKEQNPEQPANSNPEQPKEQNPEQEKPTLWDRIGGFFGRHKQPESSPEVTEAPRGKWEGLETAPQPNGSGWTVLPGNNFDKFSDIDRNYSNHPRTDLKKNGDDYTATVNPADIEGVYLGDTEVENPDNFWGMHNGSKDAWMDTASHIPEVQERLNAGDSLDSLLDDDRLGPCANAYFNPNNPQAIEVDAMPDGGYMFSGNGRHRVIAAREYGYDIPVRVTGRYD